MLAIPRLPSQVTPLFNTHVFLSRCSRRQGSDAAVLVRLIYVC